MFPLQPCDLWVFIDTWKLISVLEAKKVYPFYCVQSFANPWQFWQANKSCCIQSVNMIEHCQLCHNRYISCRQQLERRMYKSFPMKNDAVILNKLNIYGNILPGISKHMAVICCCIKFPNKYKSISNNKSIVKTFLKAQYHPVKNFILYFWAISSRNIKSNLLKLFFHGTNLESKYLSSSWD